MTYRDDHEAALERIEALRVDLARIEAERMAAEVERDRLLTELEWDAPKLATTSDDRPMTRDEVEGLVKDLSAARRTSATSEFAVICLLVVAALLVWAAVAIEREIAILLVPVVVSAGYAIFNVLEFDGHNWPSVLTAVRVAPEQICSIDHDPPTVGRIADRAWIRTEHHVLCVEAKDITELLHRLDRRRLEAKRNT